MGGYYGKEDLVFNSKQLNKAGGTIGLGLPLKNVAHINLAADFGSIGAADKALVKENYYRLTVGLVLNDIWFIKRKFD